LHFPPDIREKIEKIRNEFCKEIKSHWNLLYPNVKYFLWSSLPYDEEDNSYWTSIFKRIDSKEFNELWKDPKN
jgi:hypothetical protein